MNKLFMKVKDYDEVSNSLIVSFASDETESQNPSDYPEYAYQPLTMWPDITNPIEIQKRIAQSGIVLAEQQKIKENFSADPTKMEMYKNMVGQTIEYNVAELILPPPLEG
jgi:hypothetical protein